MNNILDTGNWVENSSKLTVLNHIYVYDQILFVPLHAINTYLFMWFALIFFTFDLWPKMSSINCNFFHFINQLQSTLFGWFIKIIINLTIRYNKYYISINYNNSYFMYQLLSVLYHQLITIIISTINYNYYASINQL